MNECQPHLWTASKTLSVFAACLLLVGSSTARAQLLWSFEPDLEGWGATDVTLAQSTFGATDGTMAMLMDDLTPGFKNNVGKTGNFGPTTVGSENAWALMLQAANDIADGKTPLLEFDLTTDLSNVTADAFLQLGMFINSSADGLDFGFTQYGTGNFIGGNTNANFPTMAGGQADTDGATLTPTGVSGQYHVTVPLGPTLMLNPATTFFDIGFKSNGGWTGTVDFAIDDMRLTGLTQFTEETIFSWETPDDPNTPVNEQLEGWGMGLAAGHDLSISSTGATDGSSALQLDRTSLPTGFTWGSAFTLESDTNPDPNVEVIDPVIQAEIDDFVSLVNGAT